MRRNSTDELLDDLYEKHVTMVARWVRRLGGPEIDTEDAVQDVFMVALRRGGEFRGDASVSTWLFRITNNVVRTRRRNERVRRWLFRLHLSSMTEARAAPATPLESIERREQAAGLYAALEKLPDAYRTAIIMYELEGLSGEEISELLGVDVRAIWVRLHRGRAKLLAALQTREQAQENER